MTNKRHTLMSEYINHLKYFLLPIPLGIYVAIIHKHMLSFFPCLYFTQFHVRSIITFTYITKNCLCKNIIYLFTFN